MYFFLVCQFLEIGNRLRTIKKNSYHFKNIPPGKIIIVQNPRQKTTYYCGECDYASITVPRLQKHKTDSGNLSTGRTHIVRDLKDNVLKVKSFLSNVEKTSADN